MYIYWPSLQRQTNLFTSFPRVGYNARVPKIIWCVSFLLILKEYVHNNQPLACLHIHTHLFYHKSPRLCAFPCCGYSFHVQTPIFLLEAKREGAMMANAWVISAKWPLHLSWLLATTLCPSCLQWYCIEMFHICCFWTWNQAQQDTQMYSRSNHVTTWVVFFEFWHYGFL